MQGQASDSQEVYLKAIKYAANPLLFEQNKGGYVETNLTTLSFYDTNSDYIHVTLDPAGG